MYLVGHQIEDLLYFSYQIYTPGSIDKLLNTIAEAEDKITVINNRFEDDIPF